MNFATVLESWYRDQLKPAFEGRVLPIDLEICEHASALLSHRTREAADCLIAATALVHKFTLVTRNTADFSDTGITLVNPWQV